MLVLPAQLGRYELTAALGAGAMGEVYRAKDLRLDRDVAIKILPEHFARDPVRRGRFEREAKAIAALSHPNILAIYDYGIEQEILFAVLELLDGETLRGSLRRSVLTWRRALEMGIAIADGLAAAHAKGIIHRDLNPENLFLTSDGRVKILDFGLARVQAPVDVESETQIYKPEFDQTDPGTVMGTVGYMSPEQVRGLTVDARSDLFSLGCVLYELVTGKRPFQRPTAADTCVAILRDEPISLAEHGQSVPPAMERIIQRCLAKEPDQRISSASELAEAQRTILMETDGLISLPSRLPPAGQPRVPTRQSLERNEAERLYLAGRYFWDKRTEDSLRRSIASFYQALDKDPTFALAWAGLADAYHHLGLWGHAPPTSACTKGKSAALRAIELDDGLSEAHVTLAVILKDYDWDFVGAERAFRRALELNHNYAIAHQWYGECLASLGRHTEAIAELRLAHDLNPLLTNLSTALARHGYFYARKYEQAAEQLRKTLATDPAFWIAHLFLGWVNVFQGNAHAALLAFEAARQLDDNPETLVGLGYAHASIGQITKAQECLDELSALATKRYVAPVNFAVLCIGMGDFDQAFPWLDRACDDHSQWLSDLGVDPTFDPVRTDPRFVNLLRRVNEMLLGQEALPSVTAER